MKKIDMIGQVFDKLTVIEEHSKTRSGHTRYVCSCSCGNTTNVLGTHLRQKVTRSCGCITPKKAARKEWKGFEGISGTFWSHHVVRSANGDKGRRKVLELSVTKEQAWQLYLDQNKKCKFSGIDIKFPERTKDKSWTASLDRIDSSIGYTLENVQWVHKDINMMKRIYSNDYFITMCKLIAENNG